ncbi:MAG: putative ABC transporter permease [Butyrivibrio sp.]|jgi:uncharacterized membrane protein|nr:putative ABC transporter permease [Butyrivibrio sp.]
MWSRVVFGTDVYHIVSAFIIYSVLGWAVESIYMSFCNRKLTNRGFGKGPFCPIYGFGGVLGYMILHPLSGSFFRLYFAGAILATAFEFMVGIMMKKAFGEIWWDYNDKKMNYKGIICLESTIAWGFYAVFIIRVLNGRVNSFIDSWSNRTGTLICEVIILLVVVDYAMQLRMIIKKSDFRLRDERERLVLKYRDLRARWF